MSKASGFFVGQAVRPARGGATHSVRTSYLVALGTKALAAERLALNQAGEGSSPSGPTRRKALVVQRPGLRTRNAATWVRVPPGALCFLDNSASESCAHDVAAAYRLAKAEVRVQLPLGTSAIGMWESLVNPPASGAGDRRFKSGHPDCLFGQVMIPVWPNGKAAPC